MAESGNLRAGVGEPTDGLMDLITIDVESARDHVTMELGGNVSGQHNTEPRQVQRDASRRMPSHAEHDRSASKVQFVPVVDFDVDPSRRRCD